jgi:hypothetical protein
VANTGKQSQVGRAASGLAAQAGRRRRGKLALLRELEQRGCEGVSSSALEGDEIETAGAGADLEALLEDYEELAELLVRRVREKGAAGRSWPGRVRCGLAAVLEAIAAEPALARVAVRGVPALGPRAYRAYVDLLDRFAGMLTASHESFGTDLPAQVGLLAVGAAESLIIAELDAGRAQRLPEKLPEILFSVLVGFLGPQRAAAEVREGADDSASEALGAQSRA